jgi:hypothetical protein
LFLSFGTRRGLYKIKTKLIAVVRVTTQDKKEVIGRLKEEEGYFKAICKYDILNKYIYNFNKTSVRIGCPCSVKVIILIKVKELYFLSLKNYKSLIIIKDIFAINIKKILLVIIV